MGLLIVNADDWGLAPQHTNAIAACFQARRISSATGMVHMRDSERAATIARAENLPIGLHLNFAEAFDAPDVTPEVRERQRLVVDSFSRGPWHRWGFNHRLFGTVSDAIRDQIQEFVRIYHGFPTHVDGHQHLHQNLTVLSSRAFPAQTKMRATFTFAPGEKSVSNRVARAVVNRLMRSRFRGPRYFVSIRALYPALGGAGLAKLDLLRRGSLEVMTHPGWADEFDVLMSDDWQRILQTRAIGSYRNI